MIDSNLPYEKRVEPTFEHAGPEDKMAELATPTLGDPSMDADVFVVPYRPKRATWKLIPPALAVIAALGLLAYRVRTPDWHWEWPKPQPSAEPIARSTDTPHIIQGPTVDLKKDVAETPAKPVDALKDEKLADASKTGDPAKAALDDIQHEADRIKQEREELAKIKEKEGEKIAAAPKRPAVGRGMNPALALRNQQEFDQFVRQRMAENRRVMNEMMRAQRQFLARNGRANGRAGALPGMEDRFDAIEEAFDRMQREMDAFERQAQGMLQGNRAPFNFPAGAAPPPPLPGPGLGLGLGNGIANQPEVDRFDFVDPNGNRVQGIRMRWGLRGGG